MAKRFRCTTHYASEGSDVVTMISCVMIDVPDEEGEMRYYIREHPSWALYRVQGDDVDTWSGDSWRPIPLTVPQLDGLGGDVYYRLKPEDVEQAKARAALARPTPAGDL